MLLDEANKPVTAASHGKLEELAAVTRGKRTTLLLDATFVYSDQVSIPSSNRQRMLQAVPFALEDNLADDIEDMHFAIGRKLDNGNVAVIAIRIELIDTILARFRQANIHLHSISSDAVTLPGGANRWSLLLDGERVLIHTHGGKVYSCDRDNLLIVLDALLEQADEKPQRIRFIHQDTDTAAIELKSRLPLEADVSVYQAHPIGIFAEHVEDARALNLLQGAYAPKSETAVLLKPWRAVAILLVCLLGVKLISTHMETREIADRNLQIKREIEQEFKKIIPNARKFSGMQSRVKQRLRELRGGGKDDAQNAFLELLATAAPVLSAQSDITVKALAFRDNTIDLDVTSKSLKTLEDARQKLESGKGIKTTMSTSVEKNVVNGRLRLEKQG